jgi:hypothetical protein
MLSPSARQKNSSEPKMELAAFCKMTVLTELHGIASWETVMFAVMAVKTSNHITHN